ncbi:MAG: hypothetical protein QM790_15145 [Nibricoccus sp.]
MGRPCRFQTGYDDYNGHVTTLAALALVQSSARVGVSLNKQQLRELMIASTLDVAGALCAFAHKTGNTELNAATDVEHTVLMELRDAEIDSRALDIYERGVATLAAAPVALADGSTVSAADYGLSEPMLQTLNNRIAAYAAVAESPRTATVKIATATQAVAAHIKAIDEVLANVLDKLVRQFEVSKPDFVAAYWQARVIVDSAASRTVGETPSAPGSTKPVLAATP